MVDWRGKARNQHGLSAKFSDFKMSTSTLITKNKVILVTRSTIFLKRDFLCQRVGLMPIFINARGLINSTLKSLIIAAGKAESCRLVLHLTEALYKRNFIILAVQK